MQKLVSASCEELTEEKLTHGPTQFNKHRALVKDAMERVAELVNKSADNAAYFSGDHIQRLLGESMLHLDLGTTPSVLSLVCTLATKGAPSEVPMQQTSSMDIGDDAEDEFGFSGVPTSSAAAAVVALQLRSWLWTSSLYA